MLTPLAEHHSDWHGSVQAYQNCKLNAFNENSKHRPKTASTDASQPLESELALPGEHNLNNAELVLSHALKLNFKEQLNLEAFFSFKGLPHRLQLVHQTDALKCINDSKATSPGAVEQALKSLSGPITLILMGVPIDGWKELLPRFSTFDISYHLVGRMHDLKMIFQHHNPKLHEDLSSCLQYLAEQQIKGSILLSPGGPSYDQYNNYEERGEHFTQLCKRFFTEL
jgi:UDP-N-acetylmuramoylalanine--D-glutamate ligase